MKYYIRVARIMLEKADSSEQFLLQQEMPTNTEMRWFQLCGRVTKVPRVLLWKSMHYKPSEV